MPKRPKSNAPGADNFTPTSVDNRFRYLEPRPHDLYCRIHKVALDDTGYCVVAGAWWVPKFACPQCAGRLWDNGFCENCTPKTQTFPGDYFEQRWDDGAGRERGHFVRVYRGPTPAPTESEVAGYMAELRVHASRVQTVPREPGDESEQPG